MARIDHVRIQGSSGESRDIQCVAVQYSEGNHKMIQCHFRKLSGDETSGTEGTGTIHNRTPEEASFRLGSLRVEAGVGRIEFSGEEHGEYQLQYGRATAVGPPAWQDLRAPVTATGKVTVIEVQLPEDGGEQFVSGAAGEIIPNPEAGFSTG